MNIEIFKGKAVKKLNSAKVTGHKEQAMAPAVREALISFCGQSEEFAQAVAEGSSFEECMKEVAKGVGRHISDIDAYKKAVAFYFPTATINFKMTINTEGNNSLTESGGENRSSSLTMSLDELLGL